MGGTVACVGFSLVPLIVELLSFVGSELGNTIPLFDEIEAEDGVKESGELDSGVALLIELAGIMVTALAAIPSSSLPPVCRERELEREPRADKDLVHFLRSPSGLGVNTARPSLLSYSILHVPRSWSYRIRVFFAPLSLLTTGGAPPPLMTVSPMPANATTIEAGTPPDPRPVHGAELDGDDCSSRVRSVVVGDSASIAKPCKSTCVRMVGSSAEGMRGNKLVSDVEKEKTWAAVGDL